MLSLETIENLIKSDNPLEAYYLLQDYTGDDKDLLLWKEKIKGYVEHAFDRGKYDEFYGSLPEKDVPIPYIYEMDKILPRIEYAYNFLKDHKNLTTLVDVGCASGENTLFFGFEGYDVTGINISSKSIENAKKKAEFMDIDAKFINKNFFDVEGTWDVVLFMEIFEHVPDPKKAVEKLWSMLNPGGLLFISTPKPNFWGTKGNENKWERDGLRGHLKLYSEEEIREILKDYNVIDFFEDTEELYNFVCQKK